MVAACPFPHPRGTPIRILRMAEALAARGHEIHVVTYHLGSSHLSARLRIHRTRTLASYRHVAPGPTYEKLLILDPLLAAKLVEVIRRFSIDLVHAHHYEGLLVAAGARRVLVGHSERRQMFGETDETCARKLRAALAAGLDPLLCVGETLEERDLGRARTVVLRQLTAAVRDLSRAEHRRLGIAYEPVWAIGTGRTAAPEDAQEMHAAIREILAAAAGPETARATPILYGGSVKPDNAAALLAGPDVDGALVGGASLDPEGFAAILAAAGSSPRVP